MKRSLLSCAVAAALGTHSAFVSALDELVLQAVKNGDPAAGYTFKLDGKTEKVSDSSGMVMFDLSGGAHSVQILKDGETVHSFRFDSAGGQLTDINISIPDSGKPKVAIESYFKTETASQKSDAATGTITGRVSSVVTPISNATISVVGTDISTETNAFGVYELTLPRGVYDLVINHPDFGTNEVKDYRVVSNVTKRSNFSIDQAREIEEVTVVAKVSAAAFQESERYSTNVIDTMGIEQLARFGDTDIAASVVRVPSVTVQDDRFVFIRGLGGRYITTTLNGSTMPSTNPSKRTVPLDLFPSNIVEQLDVKKTFIASMPGESTGGNLVINTRSYPEESSGKLSFSLGYVSDLTGDDALVDPQSGNFDVIGWDDGERKRPIDAYGVADALEYSDQYSSDVRQQLERIGGLAIKDDWDVDQETANPDVSLGMNYGDLVYLDSAGAEIGYFVAANYKNQWSKKGDGIRRTYGGVNASQLEDDFEFEEFSNSIDASGLLALSLILDSSTYQSNTIVSRVTEETVNYAEGFDGDAVEASVKWSIEWVERQYLSQQFTGQHLLGKDEEWTVDWQVTASRAERYAPDRRDVQFNDESGTGVYNLEVPVLSRRYDELTDDNLDFSADAEYLIGTSRSLESILNFGFQVISRERDSDSDTYGYRGGALLDDSSPNLSVSDVINDETITGNPSTGYAFADKTIASDSYDAEMDLNSVYISYDAVWNTNYQVVVGARYEDYEQVTDTFNIVGGEEAVQSNIEEDIILPSLSLNWFFAEDQQLRFAVSKTVSRPDFKETANAVFYDDEFNVRVRGNPFLEVSEVVNYDLRWEKYWTDVESVSLALFYKDLSDPIERVVLAASGTAGNSRTFRNADSGEVFGIEFDGRRDFPFNEALTKSVFVSLNASYIDSEVTFGEVSSDLQGAPDYTLNFIVGFDDIENGHELTLLLNQNGDTVVDKGVAGQPDIIEEPRMSFNVNYKYTVTDDLTFKAKIENLLDDEVEFTQGGEIFQSYKKGMEFKAGFDWQF